MIQELGPECQIHAFRDQPEESEAESAVVLPKHLLKAQGPDRTQSPLQHLDTALVYQAGLETLAALLRVSPLAQRLAADSW